jgi:rare lipoprotein A
MQTTLRVVILSVVASLLSINPMSAAPTATKAQGNRKSIKTRYIGTASWYGEQHQGRKMANGQRFDRHKLTAASWYFPLGTTLRVENVKNGASVVVTVTDRGPNLRLHRMIDLSEAAAARLGYVEQGLTPVFIYPVPSFDTKAARNDSGLIGTPAHQHSGELEAKAFAAPM